jgi:hypothetical protein
MYSLKHSIRTSESRLGEEVPEPENPNGLDPLQYGGVEGGEKGDNGL